MPIQINSFKIGHEGYQNGVSGFYSGPNSAGGISVKGAIYNTGTKPIKYISVYFQPFNAVGDAVGCTIKKVSKYGLQITGPIGANRMKNFYGENMWYNNSITSVRVCGAEVQYIDGTEETIQGNQIFVKTGCYIATCVYGSYDCPQVWTLRRYRDFVLAETWYGRLFIKTYYAISPTIVKWFGKTEWFKKLWKNKLDKMVAKLQEQGYESTEYNDKY